VLADADTIVPGRELDDDAHVLIRFDNGAKGILMASQICAGAENNLSLRVIGEHGALQWSQHDPNTMQVFWNDQPTQIFRTGRWQDLPGEAAARHQRMPAGHPEGYIEAFANIYRNMARLLLTKANGQEPDPRDHDFPTHHDGYRGMALVQAVYDSSRRENTWVEPRQFAG
jgi:predicted dehydrogenase